MLKYIKWINFNNLNSQLEIRCRKGPKYTLLKMHRQVKESPVTLEYLWETGPLYVDSVHKNNKDLITQEQNVTIVANIFVKAANTSNSERITLDVYVKSEFFFL